MAFTATPIVALLCLFLPLLSARQTSTTNAGSVTSCGATVLPVTHLAGVSGEIIMVVNFNANIAHLNSGDVLRWTLPRYRNKYVLPGNMFVQVIDSFVHVIDSNTTSTNDDPPTFFTTLRASVPLDQFSIEIHGLVWPFVPGDSTEVSNFTIIDDGVESGFCSYAGIQLLNANPRVVLQIPDQTNLFPNTVWSFSVPVGTFVDANSHPMHFVADGVPAWMTFDGSQSSFSGIPPHQSQGTVYNLTITATDDYSGIGQDSFLAKISNRVPSAGILSAQSTNVGVLLNFTIPPAAFTDPDGDDFTFTLFASPSVPSWLHVQNNFIYGTPASGDQGTKTVTVVAHDFVGATVNTTISITVLNRNPTQPNAISAPDAVILTPYSFSIPANTFSDPDGDTVTLQSNGAGFIHFTAPNTFSGTAHSGDQGSLSVPITVTDLYGGSSTFSFTINVQNQAPVAVAGGLSDQNWHVGTAESYTIPSGAFTDADQDPLSYSLVNAQNWMSVSNGNHLTGTPPGHSQGQYCFSIVASDAYGGSTSSAICINVVNRAPNPPALPDQNGLAVDIPWTYTVPSFVDPDGDVVFYLACINPNGGGTKRSNPTPTCLGPALPSWLSFSNGVFSGTPRSGDQGTYFIKLVGYDYLDATGTGYFQIVVVNRYPERDAGISDVTNLHVLEAFSFSFPLNAFKDLDGDILCYAIAATGTAPPWLHFNAFGRQFFGTPTVGSQSPYTITVNATDPFGGFALIAFSMTVVNRPPQGPNNLAINNNLAVNAFFNVTLNPTDIMDPDHDAIRYMATNVPSWAHFDSVALALTGTPTVGSNNPALQNYIINILAFDTPWNASFSSTIILTVVNRAPNGGNLVNQPNLFIFAPWTYSFSPNLFSDADGDTLTYTPSGMPAWMHFTFPTFSGTPVANSQGSSTISLTVADPYGGQILVTFVVTVNNRDPQLDNRIPDQNNLNVGTPWTFTFASNVFSDPDSDSLIYAISQITPAAAWISLDGATRTFSGTPPQSSQGDYTVSVTATDPSFQTASTGFTIHVVNRAPFVQNAIPSQNASVNVQFNYQFAANTFSDPDGDSLTYTINGNPTVPAWLSFNAATRTFTGTPPTGSQGDYFIDVTATDASAAASNPPARLKISVDNFSPIISGQLSTNFSMSAPLGHTPSLLPHSKILTMIR